MIGVRCKQLPNSLWELSSAYDKRFVDLAHEVPGLRWNKAAKIWTGYSDAIHTLTKQLTTQRIAKVINPPTVPNHLPIQDTRLHPFQQIGASFLVDLAREGALLTDGLGLGKSRQTLAAGLKIGEPGVIVCPASVKHSWRREASIMGIDAIILSGTAPPDNAKLSQSDGLVIINYDIIHKWLPILQTAKWIGFDECHALINSDHSRGSRRGQACKELALSIPNRMGLSGTPYPSRLHQLHGVVDVISPNRFGPFLPFVKRYCGAFRKELEGVYDPDGKEKIVWDFTGTSNQEELKERLSFFMLRRTKNDVGLELPPKTRQIIEVEIDQDAITSWNWQDSSTVRYALRLAATGKFKHAANLTESHLTDGNSVVVFVYERASADAMQTLLLKRGIEPFVVTGAIPVEKRIEILQNARDHQPCVVIATTHSVGQGINDLVFANVAIVCELDYVPLWIIQCEGRLDRQGQTRNVLIQYLIGLNSIDEKIRDGLLTKLETFESTIGEIGDGLGKDLHGDEEASLQALIESIRKMK